MQWKSAHQQVETGQRVVVGRRATWAKVFDQLCRCRERRGVAQVRAGEVSVVPCDTRMQDATRYRGGDAIGRTDRVTERPTVIDRIQHLWPRFVHDGGDRGGHGLQGLLASRAHRAAWGCRQPVRQEQGAINANVRVEAWSDAFFDLPHLILYGGEYPDLPVRRWLHEVAP